MNSDILRRMRDQLASVDTDEARALVAEYDTGRWFVDGPFAEQVEVFDEGDVE